MMVIVVPAALKPPQATAVLLWRHSLVSTLLYDAGDAENLLNIFLIADF